MFKDKILAQLVAKYPGVQKTFLLLWAAKLEAKVTEESAIEGVVNELDNLPISIPELALEYQKEGDRRVAAAKKPAPNPDPKPGDPKPNPEPQPTPGNPEPKPQPNGDEPPAWAKTLMQDIAVLKGEKAKTAIETTVAQKLGKDVPVSFWKGKVSKPLPEKEEDIDAFVENLKADYTDMLKETGAAGFGAQTPPAGGSGGGANGKATKEEIKGIVAQL